MITKLQSFVVNSYYCQKVNDKTSQIYYTFDCPQGYLSEVSHLSCTLLNVPKTWYQLDVTDFITLVEGDEEIDIFFEEGDYLTKQNMMSDLATKLTNASTSIGNNFVYSVNSTTGLIDTNGMVISVNDNTKNKKIKISDGHLRIMFGLQEENIFLISLTTKTINLNPITNLYLHCSGCSSFNNSGIFSANIIASINVSNNNTTASYELKANMKPYSGIKEVTFSITDFDNEVIDLNGNNFDLVFCLFKYEENWIEKLEAIIEYEVTKDQIKQNNYGIVQEY